MEGTRSCFRPKVALAGEASLPGARVIPIEHRSDVPLLQRRVEPNEGEVVCYDLWRLDLVWILSRQMAFPAVA